MYLLSFAHQAQALVDLIVKTLPSSASSPKLSSSFSSSSASTPLSPSVGPRKQSKSFSPRTFSPVNMRKRAQHKALLSVCHITSPCRPFIDNADLSCYVLMVVMNKYLFSGLSIV